MSSRLTSLPALDVPRPAQPVIKAPTRIELALFCRRAAATGQVSYRRLEQATANRKWSLPSPPLTTDARGHTVLPLLSGIYLLTAQAAGCATMHQKHEVKEGLAQQSVELFLEQGRAISGTVRDATTQHPVGGALIAIQQRLALRGEGLSASDDAWTAIADSLGRYRVEGVGDGDFQVRCSAEGFADARASISVLLDDARADLALEPAGFVEGSVRPITSAATVKDLRDDARTVFVNADGSFRLAVASGDHLLLAEDASGAMGMTRVNVPARSTLRGVELKLARGGKIRGTASLAGAPAVCARVWIRAESDPYEISSAQVTVEGAFTIERVPAGRYWLFAECPDGEHGDVLGVEPDRPDPVEVTLKQAAGLVVRVRDSAGRPVGGAEVEVSQPGREPVTAVTNAQGHLELSKLLLAVVNVEVRSSTRQAPSQKVQLVEGQAVSADFTLVETGTIIGRIEGSPDQVVGINAWSKIDGLGGREKVAADGTFKLRLLPGHFKVFPWLRSYHGFDHAKELDLEAGQEVRADFVVSTTNGPALEASAPGTIGASFDDGPGGVSISWVIAGSPVDKAGLKQGDLMLAIDGKPLQRSVDAFARTKGQPGSGVKIAYRRGGADAEVVVTRAGGNEL